MDYIFVATDSQAGSKVIHGPITGKDWLVTPQGSWIADEFDRTDKVLNIELYRYCIRERQMIRTYIYLLNPSWRDMEQMPTY